MNDSILEDPDANATPVADCCTEVDQYVRRNPGAALFFAIGAGLLFAILVRALRPEPTPRARLAHFLEDLEDRLRDAATPAVRKAGSLASNGVSALHGGEVRVEGLLRDARRRLRKLLG